MDYNTKNLINRNFQIITCNACKSIVKHFLQTKIKKSIEAKLDLPMTLF